jgi:hypothetical protein
VREEVLPEIEARFSGLYTLRQFDVSIPSNAVRLVAYQQALKSGHGNAPVSMVVDYSIALDGFDAIREGLATALEGTVSARLDGQWIPPHPIVVPPTPVPRQPSARTGSPSRRWSRPAWLTASTPAPSPRWSSS